MIQVFHKTTSTASSSSHQDHLLTFLSEPITVDPAFYGTIYSYQATPSHASNYPSQTATISGGTTIVVAASGAASAASSASVAAGAGGGSATYSSSSSQQTVYGNSGSSNPSGATNVSSSGAIVMSNRGSSVMTSSNLQISIVALMGFFIAVLAYL